MRGPHNLPGIRPGQAREPEGHRASADPVANLPGLSPQVGFEAPGAAVGQRLAGQGQDASLRHSPANCPHRLTAFRYKHPRPGNARCGPPGVHHRGEGDGTILQGVVELLKKIAHGSGATASSKNEAPSGRKPHVPAHGAAEIPHICR